MLKNYLLWFGRHFFFNSDLYSMFEKEEPIAEEILNKIPKHGKMSMK